MQSAGGSKEEAPGTDAFACDSEGFKSGRQDLNLRPLGPEPVTGTVHAVAGDGRPSQVLDATGVELGEAVEGLPTDRPNGRDGSPSAEQVAADLRRTEFLRPEGLLPVAAVAKRLGISAASVHAAINAGKLRAVLFGSVRRIALEDLDAYVRLRNADRPPADEEWCTVADLARAAGCSRAPCTVSSGAEPCPSRCSPGPDT